ncbi:hypothetical protein ANCCAN_25834 [Ancylostoma caninum]|uniref:Surfactant protein B n=1 Tax=Ancylostoma caninum TaxID=29170 RepID=A0A368F8C8_ANCCA|nr:hypothetical protein ANCCAN_25834 [Ancylostoma caninum]
MRRLVLCLLLAGLKIDLILVLSTTITTLMSQVLNESCSHISAFCTADFSNEDVFKYGRTFFNECTLCRVQNAVKQRPELLKEITSKIPALPDLFRPHAMLAVQRWTKECSESPISDCRSACGAQTSNSTGCEELLALNGRLNEFLVSLQNDAAKQCSGQSNEKSCLEQRHSSNGMVSAAVKEAIQSLASLIDPRNSCGVG